MNTRQLTISLLNEGRDPGPDIKAIYNKYAKLCQSQLIPAADLEALQKTFDDLIIATEKVGTVDSYYLRQSLSRIATQLDLERTIQSSFSEVNINTATDLLKRLDHYGIATAAARRCAAGSAIKVLERVKREMSESVRHFRDLHEVLTKKAHGMAPQKDFDDTTAVLKLAVTAAETAMVLFDKRQQWSKQTYDRLVEESGDSPTSWSAGRRLQTYAENVGRLEAIAKALKSPVSVIYRKFLNSDGTLQVSSGDEARPKFPTKNDDHKQDFPCSCHTDKLSFTEISFRRLVSDLSFVYAYALRGEVTSAEYADESDEPAKGEIIAKTSEGVWVHLQRRNSRLEAELARHCGDSHVDDGQLVSYRVVSGKAWSPELTAVVTETGCYLYCYGAGNAEVQEKDHDAIVTLLSSPSVKGTYAYDTRDNNVWLALSKERRDSIISAHDGAFLVDPRLLAGTAERDKVSPPSVEEWNKLCDMFSEKFNREVPKKREPTGVADEGDQCAEDDCENRGEFMCEICGDRDGRRYCREHVIRCDTPGCEAIRDRFCEHHYDEHNDGRHTTCTSCEETVGVGSTSECVWCNEPVCEGCQTSCDARRCDVTLCSSDGCRLEHEIEAHAESCKEPGCTEKAFPDLSGTGRDDNREAGAVCSICDQAYCDEHSRVCPLCGRDVCAGEAKDHLRGLHSRAECKECGAEDELDISLYNNVLCKKHIGRDDADKSTKKADPRQLPMFREPEPQKAESLREVAARLYTINRNRT